MTLSTENAETKGARRGAFSLGLFGVLKHKMQWLCPTESCEATYAFPVEDPPGNKVLCNGCGNMVTLLPGEMDAADRRTIERVKQDIRENPELYDVLSQVAETRANYDVKPEPLRRSVSGQSYLRRAFRNRVHRQAS